MDSYSDELLNAFIDGELDEQDKSRLLADLGRDPALSARVCELRKVRDMLQLGYASVPAADRPVARTAVGHIRRWRIAVAASMLLAVGIVGGWISHASLERQPALTELAQTVHMGRPSADSQPWRLVLHVTTNDPFRLETALQETQQLLENNRTNGNPIRVEILANGRGLELLRKETSPYATQIRELQKEFGNLAFLACGKAIQRLQQEKRISVNLLPQVQVVPSAINQIMQRQQDGWGYIRI